MFQLTKVDYLVFIDQSKYTNFILNRLHLTRPICTI